jgi:hypothetical protein
MKPGAVCPQSAPGDVDCLNIGAGAVCPQSAPGDVDCLNIGAK